MKRIPMLLLIAASFVVVSCGGGSSPEDEVSDVADQILEAETDGEVSHVCQELITPALLKEVYGGSLERCEDQPLNDESGIENPGEVNVASVKVDGEKAEAAIETTGGDTEDNDGAWYFTKVDDHWKLSRFGDDYLRSAFAVSVQNVDEGVISYEPMRKCMSGQIQKLKPSTVRRFMFQTTRGEKEKATDSVLKIAKACPRPMAEFVADELATRVLSKKDVTEAQIRCAKKKMVPLLELTDLSSIALNSSKYGDASGYALAGLIAGVMKQCPA